MVKNEFDNSRLRGRIIEKYGNAQHFSEVIRSNPTTVSRLLNNKQIWTREVIETWRVALEIEVSQIGYYFWFRKNE